MASLVPVPFVYKPEVRTSVSKAAFGNGLPKLDVAGLSPQPEGFIAYSTANKQIYYSNGSAWVQMTGTSTFTDLTVTHSFTTQGAFYDQSMVVTSGPTYTVGATDEFIFCNTSGGSITVNLPAGVKGRQIFVADIGRSYGGFGASANPIQVNAQGTDVFAVNNGTTKISPFFLSQDGARVRFLFVDAVTSGLSTGMWYFEADTTAAPINPVVYVTSTGSDNNTGLSLTQGVASLQKAINIISGIGWEGVGTIQIDASSYNVNNLTFPNIPFGVQQYPLVVRGTLTLVRSGTLSAIANTYSNVNAPDLTGNVTYTGTVTSTSGSHTLQGAYLQMTSGAANGVGYFVVDNTGINPSSESYQMCAFPNFTDAIQANQPAPQVGDTYSLYTRGTTIAFTGSVNSQVNGVTTSSEVYFRDLEMTQASSTNQRVLFGTAVYYFTNVGMHALQVPAATWNFTRSARIITGRSIISFGASSAPSATDVAGIYVEPSSTNPANLVTTGEGSNFSGCFVRAGQVTIQNCGSAAFNAGVLTDSVLNVQAASTCSSVFVLAITTSATVALASFLVQNSRYDFTSGYVVGTSTPNTYVGILIRNASNANLTNVNITGVTGTKQPGCMITNSSCANIVSMVSYANAEGMIVQNGSSATINVTATGVFTTSSFSSTTGSGSGIVLLAGSRLTALPGTTLTCNSNLANGIYCRASTAVIKSTNFTADHNGIGIDVIGGTLELGDDTVVVTPTVSNSSGVGISVSDGGLAILIRVIGTGNNTAGCQIIGGRVQVDANTTVTAGAGNEIIVGANTVTTWANVNQANSTAAHCTDYFNGQTPTTGSTCRLFIGGTF